LGAGRVNGQLSTSETNSGLPAPVWTRDGGAGGRHAARCSMDKVGSSVKKQQAAHSQLLESISEDLIELATGQRILLTLAVFAVYSLAIMGPAYGRIETYSGGVGAIDFLIAYTPEQAYDMIAAYGPQGRQYYATIALTLDVLFPFGSAFVFSLILTHIFHRAFREKGVLQRTLLVPPAAMVADLLENVTIATMLLSYPRQLPPVALAASAFSTVKWTAVAAQLALVAIGLIVWVIREAPRWRR